MRLKSVNYFIRKHSQKCEDELEFRELIWDMDQVVREVSETASMLTVHRCDQQQAFERDWKVVRWQVAAVSNVVFLLIGVFLGWLIF